MDKREFNHRIREIINFLDEQGDEIDALSEEIDNERWADDLKALSEEMDKDRIALREISSSIRRGNFDESDKKELYYILKSNQVSDFLDRLDD
jgi:hypothetical protein